MIQTQRIDIDLNPELFNNLYWHLKEAFEDPKIRFIWVPGGSSASKTFSAVQLDCVEKLNGSANNTMVLRKYGSDIEGSIYSDYKGMVSDWGLDREFIIQKRLIKCRTKSFIRFRGLDDSEKIKGLTRFKRVILEELSQFDEVDLKQVKKRLRGRSNQQIVGIFNPISEEHWIKTNVFDKDEWIEIDTLEEAKQKNKKPEDWVITGKWVNKSGNSVILKSTYLDNKYIVGPHFVDHHVLADFENDKKNDFAYYQIYGLGNWGKLRTGGEFWKDFNPNKHIQKVKWNEDMPIHLSWDENVNPFLTCTVWQIIGKKMIQIDEICLSDPLNRIKHVCAEFMKRYPQARVKGLFIYGDKTSWKEDTKKEKGENFFTDIMNCLLGYKPSLRLQSVNPSIVQSGRFINECYARNEGGIEIIIGDNCKKSIHDYQYALEDSDGSLKKTKKKHPITDVVYEEFGHPSDTKRYIATVAFANEYHNYLRGGRSARIVVGKKISKNIY